MSAYTSAVVARGFCPAQRVTYHIDDLRRVGEPQGRVLAQAAQDLGDLARPQRPCAEFGPLSLQVTDAVEPDLVDLFGREVGGGMPAYCGAVALLAAWSEPHAHLVVATRPG